MILARSGIAHEPALGLLAAVGGLIGMTAATLYEKRFGVTTHPVPANLIQYVVGAVFTLPLAITTVTRAQELAARGGHQKLAEECQAMLDNFKSSKPWRTSKP